MVENIDEVNRIIKEKNLKEPEEVYKITQEELKKSQFFFENMNKIIGARGKAIEGAINVEECFNNIILLTSEPFRVTEHFDEKATYVQKLIKKYDKNRQYFNRDSIDKLIKIVKLRNIFAHVPINSFNKELEFSRASHYNDFFEYTAKTRDVKTHFLEFSNTGNEIIEKLRDFLFFLTKQLKNGRLD